MRFMEPRVRPIARATDLGSVQVLKHGNVYLLTDQFGDIHPDSRGLGLYRTDTRLLSCSVLHVGGERPVLLQGSMGGNYRGAIQLTNPSADRNPDMKVHPLDDLVGRTIGISRDRLIGGGALEELVRIVNHADRAVTITVELDMGTDDADIFEVRGYPRPARGTLLPVAVTPERITFRYDGLDGVRRSTYLAFSQPASEIGEVAAMPADPLDTGATVRLRWSLALEPRAAGELRWTVWADTGPVPPDAAAEPDAATLFPEPPLVSGDEGAAAYRAWDHGTTTVDSDHEIFDRVMERSIHDLRLLVNDGPGPDQRYIAAGVPWFATLFGRDSIIASFQSLAVPAAGRGRDAVRAGGLPGHRGRRPPRRGARQDPPRAADRRDGRGRRAAAHALLRLGGFDAALADPARRDLRLDRRSRHARSAVAQRAGRRSGGSTRTATATGTGSSSTSAGPSAAS